jgi:hypothetical protein
MPMPASLKRLDDRILGRNRHREVVVDEHGEAVADAPPPRAHDGVPTFLSVVYRVSRLVFLALALIVALAVVLILAPANDDNVIVSTIFDWAEQVAGPFKDVFALDGAEREKVVNYALAAVVYLVAASLVTKLPTFGSKAR